MLLQSVLKEIFHNMGYFEKKKFFFPKLGFIRFLLNVYNIQYIVVLIVFGTFIVRDTSTRRDSKTKLLYLDPQECHDTWVP